VLQTFCNTEILQHRKEITLFNTIYIFFNSFKVNFLSGGYLEQIFKKIVRQNYMKNASYPNVPNGKNYFFYKMVNQQLADSR
jgi:hypothetical protein